MNDPELNVFETELKKLRPAKAPEELITRLMEGRQDAPVPTPTRNDGGAHPGLLWKRILWGLAPACAALVLVGVLLNSHRSGPTRAERTSTAPEPPVQVTSAPEAAPDEPEDALEIDRYLVASFETVAESPERGPVRLRVDQWLDTVVFKDADTGIAIERHIPRVQVVPVRLESY
jgi:hypothetical protein